jgi:hypothetical protein
VRNVVGVPQFEGKAKEVVPTPVFKQDEPPKPPVGLADDPCHAARVTSVHEEAAAAAPVPAGHAVHAVEPATAKVLTPHATGSTVAAAQ